MIQITEYWEKTEHKEPGKFVNVLKGQYEIKSISKINNTLADLKARYRMAPNPKITVYPDRIVEDCGRRYGIHSYREIKEIEN